MTTATAPRLLEMSPAQLDEAFAEGSAATIPEGIARGTVIVLPGTAAAAPAAWLYGLLWRGKQFDAARGELQNLVTPAAVRAAPAAVYVAPSWIDGKDSIVLDYARRSRAIGWIRDEIREIAPGLYLGVAWVGRRRVLRFALAFGA